MAAERETIREVDMDEIRAQIQEALKDHLKTPTELLVEDIIQRLAPHLKGPPVPVIEPGALRAWIDGTLHQKAEKRA